MTAASRRSVLIKALALVLLATGLSHAAAAERGEYILVSGGPALRTWENLRRPGEQHDRWWGNFVRPARMRIEEIQKADPGANITWLVYRRSYQTRGSEEKRGLTEQEASVYLGISRSTLRHGRSDGARENRMPPPPFVQLGRKIVYLKDDLDAWLTGNRRDLMATARETPRG